MRGFLDTPVDLQQIQRLVVEASRAASGGNLQPWHVDIVTGDAMNRLKQKTAYEIWKGDSSSDVCSSDLGKPKYYNNT